MRVAERARQQVGQHHQDRAAQERGGQQVAAERARRAGAARAGATRPTNGTEPATAVARAGDQRGQRRGSSGASRAPAGRATPPPRRRARARRAGARAARSSAQPAQDERGGELEVGPAAALQPAGEPEEHRLHAELLGGDQQHRRAGAGERRHREAGQQQAVQRRRGPRRGRARRPRARRPWRPRTRPAAAPGRPRWPSPACTASTAPSAAPALTPRRPESAIGLRKTDCSTAPTTASPPPTSAASSTRGSRTDQRIVSPVGVERRPRRSPGRRGQRRGDAAERRAARCPARRAAARTASGSSAPSASEGDAPASPVVHGSGVGNAVGMQRVGQVPARRGRVVVERDQQLGRHLDHAALAHGGELREQRVRAQRLARSAIPRRPATQSGSAAKARSAPERRDARRCPAPRPTFAPPAHSIERARSPCRCRRCAARPSRGRAAAARPARRWRARASVASKRAASAPRASGSPDRAAQVEDGPADAGAASAGPASGGTRMPDALEQVQEVRVGVLRDDHEVRPQRDQPLQVGLGEARTTDGRHAADDVRRVRIVGEARDPTRRSGGQDLDQDLVRGEVERGDARRAGGGAGARAVTARATSDGRATRPVTRDHGSAALRVQAQARAQRAAEGRVAEDLLVARGRAGSPPPRRPRAAVGRRTRSARVHARVAVVLGEAEARRSRCPRAPTATAWPRRARGRRRRSAVTEPWFRGRRSSGSPTA